MKIIILGSGFSSLKLCSLLSWKKKSKYNITLISRQDQFQFLPLLPNYIDGSIKSIETNVEEFCLRRLICWINESMPIINHEKNEVVLSTGKCLKYDLLIDGTGKSSNISKGCRHEYWGGWLKESKTRFDGIELKSLGIAEFEVINSIQSRPSKKNLQIIHKVDKGKTFSRHPVLNKIHCIKGKLKEFDSFVQNRLSIKFMKAQNERTKVNSSDINFYHSYESAQHHNSVIFIGEKAAEGYATGEATAQFASFSSYQAYKFVIKYAKSRRSREKEAYIKDLNAYKPRGFMLYCGKKDALIFMGNPKKVPPFIRGRVGSWLRVRYYIFQRYMFYIEKKPLEVIVKLYFWLKCFIKI